MGKLLVLTNQQFRGCLIDAKQMSNVFFTIFFDRTEKRNRYMQEHLYEIKSRKLRSQIMIRSSFILKENHVFVEEEDSPSDKVVIVEEELDDIDIDGILNLVDVPKVMLIDEECGSLKVVVDGGELAINNDGKEKSDVLQAYRCPLCDKCYKRD